eukprot:359847-Chlamydomonas_euryale.AAC.1
MCAKVLKYLPDEGVQEAVRRGWADGQVPRGSEKLPRSVQRWRLLLAEVGHRAAEARADKAGGGAARARRLDRAVEEIVLAFSYPRLDMEVSKKMNHLLKAPFCVHPKTGKVGGSMDMRKQGRAGSRCFAAGACSQAMCCMPVFWCPQNVFGSAAILATYFEQHHMLTLPSPNFVKLKHFQAQTGSHGTSIAPCRHGWTRALAHAWGVGRGVAQAEGWA